MADVLSRSKVFSLCENRSGSISHKKRDFSSDVRFSRSRSQNFQGLRSCWRSNGILGKRLNFGDLRVRSLNGNPRLNPVQMKLEFPKTLKWWKKGLQPNMKEIESADDLVGSLLNAGNRLVIVDFFSPGCGGCRALHPKICQFAENNPDVMFLQVNYEQHKSMCYSLNVHVLPFFRFYRGANGRLCSFSCTNATIKKFKDALAKHTTERCSLGPAKGLEEAELHALAANKDLSLTIRTKPVPAHELAEAAPLVHPLRAAARESGDTLVGAGR